jgi:PAS domain S-box-containing protein
MEMDNGELKRLQKELGEAHELIEAIRSGSIDALAVNGHEGTQIFTLKSADLLYRLLIERMNEGAMILNHEGLILYANTSIAHFLDIPLKNLMGQYFFNLIDPVFSIQFHLLFTKAWEGQSKGEFMMKDRKGTWIPFYFSLSRMETGEEHVLGLIITNLSAKNEIKQIRNKVAEQNALIEEKNIQLRKDEEIKREAERLAIVLEGLPQMAWTATPEGLVNYYNQRWYNYTGCSFEETKELGWRKVLHPDWLESNVKQWKQALSRDKAYEMEALLLRGFDQQYRWHLVRARPIKNEMNETVLWVGTCTDVHDTKEALEQLAKATELLTIYNQDLEKKNEELIRINNDLDNFLYLASHDLKAPISNIEGLLNAFFEDIQADEEHQPMAEMMFASVERFKKTILDLTEISKAHKEDQEELEELQFDKMLEEVVLDIKDLIQRKEAQLFLQFQVERIRFYKRVLRSVLYNLISNAIKYNIPGVPPIIHITTKREGDVVVLSVKDNGQGLSKESQLKIFKMFQRIHTEEEGSGIGLYIIKRMVENVNGRIEVESTPLEGSIFRVFLPVRE